MNGMDIGKMNHRVTILRPVMTEDEGFGSELSFDNAGQIWAEFLKQRITVSAMEGAGNAVTVTQGMRIRPREIGKNWKVVEVDYDNGYVHEYRVIDVDRSDKACYVLTTSEVAR